MNALFVVKNYYGWLLQRREGMGRWHSWLGAFRGSLLTLAIGRRWVNKRKAQENRIKWNPYRRNFSRSGQPHTKNWRPQLLVLCKLNDDLMPKYRKCLPSFRSWKLAKVWPCAWESCPEIMLNDIKLHSQPKQISANTWMTSVLKALWMFSSQRVFLKDYRTCKSLTLSTVSSLSDTW